MEFDVTAVAASQGFITILPDAGTKLQRNVTGRRQPQAEWRWAWAGRSTTRRFRVR